MSEREDRKLAEVALARYAYRHEAEFAAGFLENAGIPFRLQIDDPLLGTALPGSATLWVLGMHERDAREVLELEGVGAAAVSPPSGERAPAPGRPPRQTAQARPPSKGTAHDGFGVELRMRERILAVSIGIAIAAVGDVVFGAGALTVSQILVASIVIVLAGVALMGRAPRFLRDILAALTGAPP